MLALSVAASHSVKELEYDIEELLRDVIEGRSFRSHYRKNIERALTMLKKDKDKCRNPNIGPRPVSGGTGDEGRLTQVLDSYHGQEQVAHHIAWCERASF